ncbi:CPBP family intramembrane glutamic endopeptidase [Streptococcus suis]
MPIHYLNILLLMVTFCPGLFIQCLVWSPVKTNQQNLNNFFKWLSLAYLVIIMIVYFVNPNNFSGFYNSIKGISPQIVVVPFFLLFLEVTISYLFIYFSHNSRGKVKIKIYGLSGGFSDYIFLFLIAFFEELVYRLFWFNILYDSLHLSQLLIILFSGLAFSINHIFMGKEVFISKLIAGIIYGLIYLKFNNFWVLIYVHIMGNLLVILVHRLLRRGESEREF